MKFLTKSWLEIQLNNFAKKIGSVFVRKDEIKKYNPEFEFWVGEDGHLYYSEKQDEGG